MNRRPVVDAEHGPELLSGLRLSRGKSSPFAGAGSLPREKGPTLRPLRGCADFISESGVRPWGLHQTRIDARSGDAKDCWRHQSGERGRSPRPRNSSVPSGRPTQCGRALAGGQSQLARGSGKGQPTALGLTGRREHCRAGTGGQSTQGTPGPSGSRCTHAVGAAGEFGASGWTRSHCGPVRRSVLPCPSGAVSGPGSRSSRLPGW